MPTPVFPASLPTVSRISISPVDNLVYDQSEGNRDVREVSVVPGATASIEWVFTRDELVAFNNFRRVALLNDHRLFFLNLPCSAGFACHIVRFIKVTVKVTGHRAWAVSADISIRERLFVPSECPAAAGLEIGFFDPLNDYQFGTLDHENAGSSTFFSGAYAGIIGYTGGTVVWSIEGGSFSLTNPVVIYTYNPETDDDDISYRQDLTQINYNGYPGLSTITATVDGVSTGEAIEIGRGYGTYGEYAWGPAPAVEDPTTWRYWRLLFEYNDYGSTPYSWQTAEILLINGAINVSAGVTPTVLGDITGSPANLSDGVFDANPITASYPADVISGQTSFVYAFAVPTRVDRLAIFKYNTGNSPPTLYVNASNNGVNYIPIGQYSVYWDYGSPGTDFQPFYIYF